jgi:hypothetical protein
LSGAVETIVSQMFKPFLLAGTLFGSCADRSPVTFFATILRLG